MKYSIKYSLILFFVGLLWSCGNENSMPMEGNETSTSPIINSSFSHLITVNQVKDRLDKDSTCVIFEISKLEKYNKGHLKNAIHLWRPDYENTTDYNYGGMVATQQQMEVLLSGKGVQSNDEIILYDTKGSVDAMRFYWILRLYGYEKIAVMNGGKTAWERAGYTLTDQPTSPLPSSQFSFPETTNFVQLATLQDVQTGITDTNTIILDTREPEEYYGKPYIDKGKLHRYKRGAFTNGCIPSARHLNWSDAVDLNGDHCFKSLKDLRYNFERIGILPHKKIITYCQSGVRSAHTSYVLSEVLGYPNVINYDGSWIEWSYYAVNEKGVGVERHTSPSEFDRLYKALEIKLQKEQ